MKQNKNSRRYRPKYMRSIKKTGKDKIALLSVLVCLLAVLSAVTLAYLIDQDEVRNTFTPTFVDCEVRETFDGSTKTNVTVENTGSTAAYVRAIVVANWVGDAGTEKAGKVYYQTPVAGADYSIHYGSGWIQHTDGYFYCQQAVAVGGSTGELITACTALQPAPVEDYHLEVEIVAEAVQSAGTDHNGTKAVVLAWGVDPASLR